MARPDIDALEERTRTFATRLYALARELEEDRLLRSAVEQLVRAGGSVAANHRALSRARSVREFAAKLQIVHEEADEVVHWLTVLRHTIRSAKSATAIDQAMSEAILIRNLFGRAKATTRERYFFSRGRGQRG